MSYLSFVFVVSHVGYGGDFGTRAYRCLENLYQQAGFFGLDADVVIVEREGSGVEKVIWSPESVPTRLITVPQAVYDTIPNPHNEGFFEYWLKNIGIRRATGEFILSTNPDNLYSPELIKRLAGDLDAGTFYRVNRYDLDKNGEVYRTNFNTAPALHFNASGDFILMHRDAWAKIHGHPEISYSLTVDGQTVHLADKAGFKQVILPEPMYHQYHEHGTQNYYEPWDDRTPYGKMNGKDWGMPEREFETRNL